MSSASTKQRVVPDVLKNEPKWSEKLASVAGLLNSKYISPWLQKPLPSSAGSVSASAPAVLYPHVFKLHADGGKIWVFLASPDTYSIWRCSNSDNSGAFQTELVFSGSDMRIMDGCICTSSDGECCYYIVTDMSEGDAKSFVVKKRSVAADSSHEATSTIASAQFSGEIVSISADKRYIALCQIGILKLLCRDSLHVFADIPSIIGIPAVFAASDRWFAVQSKLIIFITTFRL